MKTKFYGVSGLFLKFFIGFWITILIVAGFAWTLSADQQDAPQNYGSIERGPGVCRAIDVAQDMQRWGGTQAMLNWLRDSTSNTKPEVFVIDAKGREISGRRVPEMALDELRTLDPATFSRGMRGHGHAHRGCGRVGVVVANVEGFGECTFFTVRTDLPPPKPGLKTLWHTPWWVWVVLLGIITTLVAGGLAWSQARPIRRLHWAMQRAAEGDLDVRIAGELGSRRDEIGALARQFDEMAERITGLINRQKRLFHDVSHELRSPLARISIAIALAQKNPQKSAELLTRIEHDVQSLDALVDELLTYARLDDNAPMTFEVLDIVPLVEAVVDDANFEGGAKGVTVALDAPEEVYINSHVDTLMRAVENLVRNALRYSPEKSTVEVAMRTQGERTLITVSDHGPGMPPDEIERMFDPFVRGKNQATGNGFGLGLAIAKRAVERHGGTLSAANRPEGGLVMTIDLPTAQKPAAANAA